MAIEKRNEMKDRHTHILLYTSSTLYNILHNTPHDVPIAYDIRTNVRIF